MNLRLPGATLVLLAVCSLLLAGCASTRNPAPVSDRTHPNAPSAAKAATPSPAVNPVARDADVRPDFYTVKRGDTLYMIALDHGLDYKELAEWNNIDNPNLIRLGQQLRLVAPASAAVATPLKTTPGVQGKPVGNVATVLAPGSAATAGEAVKSQPKGLRVPYSEAALAQMSASTAKPPPLAAKPEPRAEEKGVAGEDDDDRVDWSWPTAGKLSSAFNETTNLKGIGIAGKAGQAINASAPGKVLYSGDGIRGYGKLVIIKHNKIFLSVYAHNSQLIVKEGQTVVKGQKIAEMGNSDAEQVKLHFEIRRFGKPVDPLKLLPADRQG